MLKKDEGEKMNMIWLKLDRMSGQFTFINVFGYLFFFFFFRKIVLDTDWL